MPVKVVYLVRTNEGLTSKTTYNRMLDFAGQIPVRTKKIPSHTEPFAVVDRLKMAYTGVHRDLHRS